MCKNWVEQEFSVGGDSMFPTINKKETGVNLRRIMDMRGVKPKDIQEYLGFGCVQSVYRWLDAAIHFVRMRQREEYL